MHLLVVFVVSSLALSAAWTLPPRNAVACLHRSRVARIRASLPIGRAASHGDFDDPLHAETTGMSTAKPVVAPAAVAAAVAAAVVAARRKRKEEAASAAEAEEALLQAQSPVSSLKINVNSCRRTEEEIEATCSNTSNLLHLLPCP